jgi:hypothetical protein
LPPIRKVVLEASPTAMGNLNSPDDRGTSALTEDQANRLLRWAATILTLLAFGATAFAWFPYGQFCDDCSGRSWELVAQAWVATVAISPAVLMWYHARNHRWATARCLLIISLVLYTAWAVLLILASD